MTSIFHRVYVALGGEKDSFLQRIWSQFRISQVNKKRSRLLNKYGVLMLELFRDTCLEKGFVGWLEYGTLLGAFRNKSFIDFDFDLDVGMYAHEYTKDFENALISKGFIKQHEYYLFDVQANTQKLTEIGFVYKGLSMDIFLCDTIVGQRKSYIYIFDNFDTTGQMAVKYYLLNQVEPFEELTINGAAFTVPSLPNVVLESVYGKNFMIPIKNWTPPKNKPNLFYLNKDTAYGIHHKF